MKSPIRKGNKSEWSFSFKDIIKREKQVKRKEEGQKTAYKKTVGRKHQKKGHRTKRKYQRNVNAQSRGILAVEFRI